MAITGVERQFVSRQCDQDLQARVKTTSVYLVTVDSLTDGEQEVGNATDPLGSSDVRKNIPRFGSLHPNIPGCFVVGVRPECSDESPFIWNVFIDYDTSPDFPQPHAVDSQGNTTPSDSARKQMPANPIARPPQWEVFSIDKTEPVREWRKVKQDGSIDYITPANWVNAKVYKRGDYVVSNANVYWCVSGGTSSAAPNGVGDANNLIQDGIVLVWQFLSTVLQATTDPTFAILSACVNSGQCPFDPTATTEVSIPAVRITKNLPMEVNFLAYCASLKNAVSKKPWKGLAARVAKVISVTAKSMTENDIDFVQVVWEVGLDPDTWDTRILDAGYGGIGTRSVANPLFPGTMGAPERIDKKEFFEHTDSNGHILSGPVPMDGKGGPLEPDSDPVFLRGIPRQQRLIDFATAIPW